jgi:hypothetical protein
MGTDCNHVILAQQALTRGDPEGRWLRLLEVFLPVGLANMNQLHAATGFSRDQVNRLLEKFRQAAGGGQPMVTRVEVKVARPWLGARGAGIYQLAETGAALLCAAGHEEARACGLKEAVAIAHAAALLDVRLAALATGLTVMTETELCNDENAALRPDNLMGPLDGRPAMFELEQIARPELLRRIVEGVRRRAEFFTGENPRPVSPIIRVLFALPRNATWERTLRIGEKAEGLAPFEVAALGGGAIVVVLILVGAGFYGVANLCKRALLVYPNGHGIFPLVRVHIGGQVIVHDPNRQPMATIVYAPDGRGGVAVTPVVLPDLLDATRAAVAQAATVQAIRAGVSGSAGLLPEHVQRVAQSLFPTPEAAPRARIIGDGAGLPQLDRLLTSGDDDDKEPGED